MRLFADSDGGDTERLVETSWTSGGAAGRYKDSACAGYADRSCAQVAERPPLRPLLAPITDPATIAHLNIRRWDRLAGLLYEYHHAA